MTFPSIRRSWYSRIISLCIIITFIATMVITPRSSYAQSVVMGLPQPGTMVNLSSAYVPLMITGLTVHPENPLLMDFIVNTGNSGMTADQVKKNSERLIKYFLACLTIPENDQWVNLSPYEKQRIVPEDLGKTVLGQDMLAQDYLLKQLTASLIYPEKNLGRNFWDQVYAKANEMYGTTQIPVNTFNKVWILPQYAKVYTHNNTVFVVKSHLKVMLDEDYLALRKHADVNTSGVIASEAKQSQINDLGSQIVRQIIIPAIEKEVNTGKNFADMRQIYNSMILAVWFKNNLKQALLNQVYSDKAKVNGVNTDDPAIKEKIYRQYLRAYKKGVFNYIKEDIDQNTQQIIPRKYFSGGLVAPSMAMITPEPINQLGADLSGQHGENFLEHGLQEEAKGNPAMTVADLREKGVSEIVLQNIEQGVITNGDHLRILATLADIGEQDLLAKWSAPGTNDDQKRKFLDQMVVLDEGYSGGLLGYKNNAKKLLRASFERKSAFEGFTPSVPQGDEFVQKDDHYLEMENEGLKAFNKTAAVLVAGGVGDRLEYNDIKVGIPLDLVTKKTYLQHYIESILADQEKSNRLNGEDRKVPLVIMTSDGTHSQIVQLLEDNNNFGMDGLSINPTRDQVLQGKVGQIIILTQGMVPAMVDNNAKFVLDNENPYLLQTKPHGHGDVHMLIHLAGLDELWLKEGRTHTFFFQDTNGEIFNAILPGLANSIRNKYALNFLTVPRDAKEAAGAIVHMKNANGQDQTFNVEYNELGPFLDKFNPGGDVADPTTGKSPYPGNLNVYIAENTTYHQKLDETGGIFGEFINPKYADTARTKFTSPTRSESMMQDYAKSLPGDEVGFTNFDKRDVFSPVKNSIARALGVVKNGNYPDSMATGEADYYKANRVRFAMAGVEVDVQGQDRISSGIPYKEGAKISYSPWFASTVQEIRSKVKGGTISSRSVLSIDGENVVLNNLQLDGTLIIRTAQGVYLTVNNLKVLNAGTEFLDLTADELNVNDSSVPQYLKLRGYKIVQRDAKVIDIKEPGQYEIGEDGQLRKLASMITGSNLPMIPLILAIDDVIQSRPMHSVSVFYNGENLPTESWTSVFQAKASEQPNKRLFNYRAESEAGNLVIHISDAAMATTRHQLGSIRNPYSNTDVRRPVFARITAQGARAAFVSPGGIDLNSRNLNMESSGEKVNITFDPAMIASFKRGDFSGVRIQILDIVPVSLMPLLGLKEDGAVG